MIIGVIHLCIIDINQMEESEKELFVRNYPNDVSNQRYIHTHISIYIYIYIYTHIYECARPLIITLASLEILLQYLGSNSKLPFLIILNRAEVFS